VYASRVKQVCDVDSFKFVARVAASGRNGSLIAQRQQHQVTAEQRLHVVGLRGELLALPQVTTKWVVRRKCRRSAVRKRQFCKPSICHQDFILNQQGTKASVHLQCDESVLRLSLQCCADCPDRFSSGPPLSFSEREMQNPRRDDDHVKPRASLPSAKPTERASTVPCVLRWRKRE
jgi:hypothetical protein